jgi:CheY-like chemotaxis protein
VVEDDEAIRYAVSIALETAGYEVLLAENGWEAIHLIESRRPSLVLLDMHMPVLDGWGFVREALARGFDPPIVIMTTSGAAAWTAQELGVAGFVGKPFNIADLLETVGRLRVP